MEDPVAIIVGAGPSGLAAAACLTFHSISHIIIEREDCFASLWKKYSYDRLHLHLRKQFCELPHMSFPASCPDYVPKDQFVQYLNDYVSHFEISPVYQRCVELASYDEGSKKWKVKARNLSSYYGVNPIEEYSARFLVVATGEASNPYTPDIDGLDTFKGEVLHSTQYKNGKAYRDRNVLVVGSGNSGMEIALDLANHGATTSIVVRSPIHVLSRGMVYSGMVMLRHLPLWVVDNLMVMFSKLVYGDLSKYGITRPREGPFFMKVAYGKYPVIDVGTVAKFKSGEIQVFPALKCIRGGNEVLFGNEKSYPFDTIVFCTGFERSTSKWLKDDDQLLSEDGLPKPSYPEHWKGKKGLYCIGLSRRGLYGSSADAKNVAKDIKAHSLLCTEAEADL